MIVSKTRLPNVAESVYSPANSLEFYPLRNPTEDPITTGSYQSLAVPQAIARATLGSYARVQG